MICRQGQRQAGISLVEAMITVFIAAIVLGLGMPSLAGWIRSAEVRTTAEALRAGLQLARLEAVQRNATVRFTLNGQGGRAAWTVGCVRATAQCPAVIRQHRSDETGAGARVGVATPVPASSSTPTSTVSTLGTALTAGSGLPAGVSFDASGRVPLNNLGSDIVRIDITHSSATVPRLVIRLGGAGMASLCNPAAALGRVEAC